MNTSLQAAAGRWNTPPEQETLEQVEERIHDRTGDVVLRSDGYINTFFDLFPDALPRPRAQELHVLEVAAALAVSWRRCPADSTAWASGSA